MNTIITLNIATGKTERFTNVEKLIQSYCQLPLRDKLLTFVIGVGEEALDYPAMMDFMFDFNKGNPSMINYLMEMDEEEGVDCE